MTCKQCKYITACMAEADGLGQVFDPNYDGEHGCTDFVPFTNAQKIRAMSDEELADVVANGVGCALKAPHCMDVDCTPCILKWLQQPTE